MKGKPEHESEVVVHVVVMQLWDLWFSMVWPGIVEAMSWGVLCEMFGGQVWRY